MDAFPEEHKDRAIIVFPGSGADYELTKKGSSFPEKDGWSRLLVAFSKWAGLPASAKIVAFN